MLDAAAEEVGDRAAVTKMLAHGRPGEQIVEQLARGEHDLVIMGSRGRGEIRSMLLGSVSHQVLNATPAGAVLIVHAERHEQ